MIKLFSKSLMIAGRDGCQRSFCFDEVRRDLFTCFRACGIRDVWAAEHIAMIVEEQLECQHASGVNSFAEEQLEALLSSVLCASGYSDVATHYNEMHDLQAVAGVPAFAAWDERRLEEILVRTLFLGREVCQELVPQVKQALLSLGFAKVSDSLISELGAHFLENRDGSAKELPHTDLYWLLGPGDWDAFFSGPLAELVATGVLKFHPVSKLIPRARVELDLIRLADGVGEKPLTEIEFLPRVHDICTKIPEALTLARKEICQRKPYAKHHPSHLIIRGLDSLLREYFVHLRRRQARAFAQEIVATVRRDVASQVSFEMVVTVR